MQLSERHSPLQVTPLLLNLLFGFSINEYIFTMIAIAESMQAP